MNLQNNSNFAEENVLRIDNMFLGVSTFKYTISLECTNYILLPYS